MHQPAEASTPAGRTPGRPPATSASEIVSVALDLFEQQGFEATTMDDIARGVGIARRTLFSYFRSKNAVVWDGRQEATDAVRSALRTVPLDAPWREALVQTLPQSLRYPDDDMTLLRRRLRLIGATPSLHAHLLVEQGSAVEAVTAFVSDRQTPGSDAAIAYTVARAVLASSSAALVWWASSEEQDSRDVMTRTLAAVLGVGSSMSSRCDTP